MELFGNRELIYGVLIIHFISFSTSWFSLLGFKYLIVPSYYYSLKKLSTTSTPRQYSDKDTLKKRSISLVRMFFSVSIFGGRTPCKFLNRIPQSLKNPLIMIVWFREQMQFIYLIPTLLHKFTIVKNFPFQNLIFI